MVALTILIHPKPLDPRHLGIPYHHLVPCPSRQKTCPHLLLRRYPLRHGLMTLRMAMMRVGYTQTRKGPPGWPQ